MPGIDSSGQIYIFGDSNCLSGYAVSYDCAWIFQYILRQITLDLTELSWICSEMKLPYDYLSNSRSLKNNHSKTKSKQNISQCNESYLKIGLPYNYTRYETKIKLTEWKVEMESSIEIMYYKVAENLSIGKMIMMATALILLILICIYGYRRQRNRAKRKQIEMIWVKVRHSLFV